MGEQSPGWFITVFHAWGFAAELGTGLWAGTLGGGTSQFSHTTQVLPVSVFKGIAVGLVCVASQRHWDWEHLHCTAKGLASRLHRLVSGCDPLWGSLSVTSRKSPGAWLYCSGDHIAGAGTTWLVYPPTMPLNKIPPHLDPAWKRDTGGPVPTSPPGSATAHHQGISSASWYSRHRASPTAFCTKHSTYSFQAFASFFNAYLLLDYCPAHSTRSERHLKHRPVGREQ